MRTSSWSGWLPSLCFLAACVVVPRAHGQAIDWEEDYSRGRATAAAQDRPLFVSVVSEACGWCRKQAETTFADRAIVAAVRKDFVALRLDAKRDARLVEALQVKGFPTIIFAASDGTILLVVDGYVDPKTMSEHIEEGISRLRSHRATNATAPPASTSRPAPSADAVTTPAPARAANSAGGGFNLFPPAPWWMTGGGGAGYSSFNSYPRRC